MGLDAGLLGGAAGGMGMGAGGGVAGGLAQMLMGGKKKRGAPQGPVGDPQVAPPQGMMPFTGGIMDGGGMTAPTEGLQPFMGPQPVLQDASLSQLGQMQPAPQMDLSTLLGQMGGPVRDPIVNAPMIQPAPQQNPQNNMMRQWLARRRY